MKTMKETLSQPRAGGSPDGSTESDVKALGQDPLGADPILENFYRPRRGGGPAQAKGQKPTHYKIVCISLYNEDIQHLEALVSELKRRGHTKANKSQVIRAALDQIDLGKIPKGY